MNIFPHTTRFFRFGTTALLVSLTAGAVCGAIPRLSGIAVRSGDRGFAVICDANTEFTAKCRAISKPLGEGGYIVAVHIPECRNGLGKTVYGGFGTNSPVRRITVHSREARRSVDIAFEIAVKPGQSLDARIKGRHLFILIADSPSPELVWNSSNSSTPAVLADARRIEPVEKEKPAGRAVLAQLREITLAQVNGIAQMRFSCDRGVHAVIDRRDNRLVVLFPNTGTTLGSGFFTPAGTAFSGLELGEASARPGWLFAAVTLGENVESVCSFSRGNEFTLVVRTVDTGIYAVWNARTGAAYVFDRNGAGKSVAGAAAVAAPVSSVQEQAVVSSVVPGAVSNPSAPEQQVPARRLVTSAEDVNLRAEPASGAHVKVLARLPLGEPLELLQQGDQWCRVKCARGSGWVHVSLVRFEAPAESAHPAGPTVATASVVPLASAMAAVVAQAAPNANTTPPPAPAVTTDTNTNSASTGGGRESAVVYRVFGRDPFIPYFRGDEEGLPDVLELQLVGIMADDEEKMALLENVANRDKAYIMREHDLVLNGSVMKIGKASVVFLLTEFGVSRTFRLELKKKGEAVLQ